MSDFLGEFLSDIGFGGAQTGADITRMLGVEDPALQQRFGQGLDPLLGTVRRGLGELPELLATLTGQARTTAGIGRERIGRGFETGRAGLERGAIGLGEAARLGTARAGFAGGGAIQRRSRRGRRQLGQQFMDILGARRTGLAGVEAGLEQSLFGAGQRVESERAGLLGSLGGGIQNLLNALISGGVQFGETAIDGGTDDNIPSGALTYTDWLNSGAPGKRPGQNNNEAYREYLERFEAQGTDLDIDVGGKGVITPGAPGSDVGDVFGGYDLGIFTDLTGGASKKRFLT